LRPVAVHRPLPIHPPATGPVEHLRALIRDVPDFPQPGILFRDLTPLLRDPRALGEVTRALADQFRAAGIDAVAGIDARGFIFGAPLAMALGVGFVPLRKPGKLPAATIAREYALEYGSAALEVHADAVRAGERVLLVDDLLATGGTARAGAELIEALGGRVAGVAFVIELAFLEGRRMLPGYDVHAVLRY